MVKIHDHTVASIYFDLKIIDFQVKICASCFPRDVTLMPVDKIKLVLPMLQNACLCMGLYFG